MTVNPYTQLNFGSPYMPGQEGMPHQGSFPVWSSFENEVAIYQDAPSGWRFYVGAKLTITDDPGDIPNQPPMPADGYHVLHAPATIIFNWTQEIQNS